MCTWLMFILIIENSQLSESDAYGESFEEWNLKREKNIYELEKEQMRLGLVYHKLILSIYMLAKLH